MAATTVRTETRGRVLIIWLDHPPRNFMTTRMVAELDELTSALEDDQTIGAVVLTGAIEDVFITHFDVEEIVTGSERFGPTISSTQAGGSLRAIGALKAMPGASSLLERSPAAGLVTLQRIHDLFLRMTRLDKVFVAAINGLALGGGCELALACDIRIMARGDHRIGLPEMTLGIIPGAGGTQRLTRILGPAKALELMLEGRALTPSEAEEVGLVHRTVDPEQLLDESLAVAARMARRSPVAVAALKRAVYEGGSRPLEEGLHIERAGFLAASSTPAARRAMRIYADDVKRGDNSAPWQESAMLERWQEGTAADLVG
jgi:enoyl-CoA hydratase